MPEFPGHATGKCLSGNMDEYANFQDISNFQASLFAAILAMNIFSKPLIKHDRLAWAYAE